MANIKNHPYIGKPINYPGKDGQQHDGTVVAVRRYAGFFLNTKELRISAPDDQIDVKIKPKDGGRCLWLGPIPDEKAASTTEPAQ